METAVQNCKAFSQEGFICHLTQCREPNTLTVVNLCAATVGTQANSISVVTFDRRRGHVNEKKWLMGRVFLPG